MQPGDGAVPSPCARPRCRSLFPAPSAQTRSARERRRKTGTSSALREQLKPLLTFAAFASLRALRSSSVSSSRSLDFFSYAQKGGSDRQRTAREWACKASRLHLLLLLSLPRLLSVAHRE